MRGFEDLAIRVLNSRLTRNRVPVEKQRVTGTQQDGLFDLWQFPTRWLLLLRQSQFCSSGKVGTFVDLEDEAFVILVDDLEGPFLAARILKANFVAFVCILDESSDRILRLRSAPLVRRE